MTTAKKVQQTIAEQYKPEHRPTGGGVFVRDKSGAIKKQLEGPGKTEFNKAAATNSGAKL